MATMTRGLRERFLAAVTSPARARFASWPGLDEQLVALWSRAVQAAGAGLVPERFAAALGAGIDEDAEPEPALAAVHADDLALACACAAGDAAALARFDALYLPDIDLAFARGGERLLGREDFRQRVRERLLVGAPDREARIAGYGGRGSLRAWVRVTAVRVMIDLSRKAGPVDAPAADARMFDQVADPADPELEYMRQAYGAAVPEAMRAGLATLAPRQRNLLRQRHLFGMSTDRLAIMYGVHRATAFRWLEEARAAWLAAMRTALGERLRVAEHEIDSVIDLLASRVDLSVRRMLDSRLEE